MKKEIVKTNTFILLSSMEFWTVKCAKTLISLSMKFLKYCGHVPELLEVKKHAKTKIKKEKVTRVHLEQVRFLPTSGYTSDTRQAYWSTQSSSDLEVNKCDRSLLSRRLSFTQYLHGLPEMADGLVYFFLLHYKWLLSKESTIYKSPLSRFSHSVLRRTEEIVQENSSDDLYVINTFATLLFSGLTLETWNSWRWYPENTIRPISAKYILNVESVFFSFVLLPLSH